MIRTFVAVLLASLILMPVARAASAEPEPSQAQQVDALFAKWNSADSPGASVAVLQDGKIIYSHGYGMASLEYGVPNTPATVFHMASVSKQFTAFAILLLARDGKLSLDDDIRKYLPEMHDFGTPITIRELLHHTSGLRDQWSLLALAGWRLGDIITEQDVLGLLWRQKTLNFPPGDQMLYCNSGYTLLGEIVKRVSGMPLSEFARQRIFEPLGMTHTHFQDTYGTVVRNRAYSYGKDHGAYKYLALSYSTVGPTSLFTTVEDMAKWDENFYTGGVGGKQVIADIQLQGTLNSGKRTDYADGLMIDKYRGLNTVWHNGADAGYRTNILRFPDQHFSVVVLANAADINPAGLSYKIADIYLADKLAPAPVTPASAKTASQTETAADPKQLADYVGDYALNPSFLISFTLENGQLMSQGTGQAKVPVYPSGKDHVFWKVVDAQFIFDRAADGGAITGGVLHQNGQIIPARKIATTPLTADRLKELAGNYYSDELNVLYSIEVKDGALSLRHPRGEFALHQTASDAYIAEFPIGGLTFTRDADGNCTGLLINDGRAQKVRFDKVRIAPVTPGPKT